MKLKTLIIFGTRPEAIKMAPLVLQLQQHPDIDNTVCVTAQHREMLDQVLELYDIKPDFDLNIMKSAQNLSDISSHILSKLSPVLEQLKPDRVFVHGDTTTAMTAAMTAFYQKIPVAHVEAGLRTGDLQAPWPEEMNRRVISIYADIHYAPTEKSQQNLIAEGIKKEQIIITGNTVIDSILLVAKKISADPELKKQFDRRFPFLGLKKKIVLITAHRRENFGQGLVDICESIALIAQNDDVQIVYPVHLNPNVSGPVYKLIGSLDNVTLLEPLDYLSFVYLMEQSYIILTDSGGIQEEAPSLGKPVLVMREATERPEAVEAGTVKLVGTNPSTIYTKANELLTNKERYLQMSKAHNPYGDGLACKRIIKHITNCKDFVQSAGGG
ncbi:MAG: UDP-N-acetylglucosamine 2-epimerase (non-hydrolyzing) [Gammaproteobacteria bacterium]|nr:UDP-N-acetylglucosamine 2-epimerase (non-hydrolyzing) [Gammaproteobacteria bacterium]